MIGRSISHYRVLSALGSGGMGVVYLAEDERLGRQVALKFLPAESVTSRQALERFRVEARAASSLSHPGICPIFDIGDDEGTPYIVMEALKGESLRDRINRGPLTVVDLLEIAIQLADALDAAHAQGIIHRDIKPANVFVGDKNRTKILDFGLAKLAQSSASQSSGSGTRFVNASTHGDLTMPGSALGTVSYMSPEQARGEDVDPRTDLFSLGVVLYEMATGSQAFGGTTQAVVFDAILNRTPTPVTQVNPLVPPRLESLIHSALEKDRDLRPQHASDFESELRGIRRDLESGSLVAASRATLTPAAERTAATTPAVTTPVTSTPSQRWIWVAAAVLVIVALTAGFALWRDTSSRVTTTTPQDAAQTAAPTETSVPAPSPDRSGGPSDPPTTADQAAARPTATTPTAPSRDTPSAAARPTPQPQPRQAGRPAEPNAQTPQPPALPTPRAPVETSTTGTAGLPLPSPNAALPQPPQIADAPSVAATAPSAPPAPPTPNQPAAEPPAAQPPPRTAATPPAQPTTPPSAPVESDDALIRAVVRTYERAIETKNVDLFRSVRPGLSAADERTLRASFSQIDSQQVDIVVEELRIDGRTAIVRLSRRDTFMSGGRRQTNASRQTLRFEKAAAGWIITEISGR